MPTYRMTLTIYTEADTASEAKAEFLAATEEADVSFGIVDAVEVEDGK
ncbi:hypothetical protein [Streptomyces sp. NPDC086519]